MFGFQRIDLTLFGCTLVPSPVVSVSMATDAIGTATVQLPWPAVSGVGLYTQALVLDAGGAQGVTASNAVWLRAP